MKIIMTHYKQYLGVAYAVLVLLLSGILYASAQENEVNAPTTDPVKTERVEQRKAKLSQAFQERIINLGSNITNRLTAHATRMSNIISRVETRIVKIKASGLDVSAGETSLAQAKNALMAAQSTLDELGSVRGAMGGDTPRETFVIIRTQYMGVRDLLKQSQAHLMQTVTLLKEATPRTSTTETDETAPVAH